MGKATRVKRKRSDDPTVAEKTVDEGVSLEMLFPEEESDRATNLKYPNLSLDNNTNLTYATPYQLEEQTARQTTDSQRQTTTILFESLQTILDSINKDTTYSSFKPNDRSFFSVDGFNSTVTTFSHDSSQMVQVRHHQISNSDIVEPRACATPLALCQSTRLVSMFLTKQQNGTISEYNIGIPFRERLSPSEYAEFYTKGIHPSRPPGFCVLCERAYTEAVLLSHMNTNPSLVHTWRTINKSRACFNCEDGYAEIARVQLPRGCAEKPDFVGLHVNLLCVCKDEEGYARIDQSALMASDVEDAISQDFGARVCG